MCVLLLESKPEGTAAQSLMCNDKTLGSNKVEAKHKFNEILKKANLFVEIFMIFLLGLSFAPFI